MKQFNNFSRLKANTQLQQNRNASTEWVDAFFMLVFVCINGHAYEAEAWPVKKLQGKKLHAMERRMLRWMCAVIKLNKIINERIRGTVEVRELWSTRKEGRQNWYRLQWMDCVWEMQDGLMRNEAQERLKWRRLVKQHQHSIKIRKAVKINNNGARALLQ